jgi:hypothetical protein
VKAGLVVARLCRKLAARRGLSVVLAGLLALAVSAALTAVRFPRPSVHDEFSYLLAADTFAHGRLSNPPHPLRRHVETFHVLMTPRYASKYPPAQGAFLALGQVLTGRPIVGAWFAVSLGCAAVCWMLQGWTRPRWALLGGCLAAIHHGVHGGIPGWGRVYSWSQSYWGGGPAMLGGALVVGALPRLRRCPARRDALLLGAGLAVLANSRPFEGLLVSAPVLALLAWDWRKSPGWFRGVVAPLVIVAGAGLLATAAVNRAATGSALRWPYALYEATYNPSPVFTLGGSRAIAPAAYRHDVMWRLFTEWAPEQVRRQRTWPGWWAYHRERLAWLGSFYLGPLLLTLFTLPWMIRRPALAIAALECGLVIGAHLASVGILPHYAAPATGCFLLLVVEGLRRVAVVRSGGRRVGRWFVWLTVGLAVADLGAVAFQRAAAPRGWEDDRAAIEDTLKGAGGRHLVVVRYRPDHDLHAEWVYNSAEIDAAPVVWARESGPEAARELLRYAGANGLRVWLLDADRVPRELAPYRPPPGGG